MADRTFHHAYVRGSERTLCKKRIDVMTDDLHEPLEFKQKASLGSMWPSRWCTDCKEIIEKEMTASALPGMPAPSKLPVAVAKEEIVREPEFDWGWEKKD